jgi:hypothetical protein
LAPNYNTDGTFCHQNYQSFSAENGSFANPFYANQTNQNYDLSWSVKLRVFLRKKTILELWQRNMTKTVIALTLTDLNF